MEDWFAWTGFEAAAAAAGTTKADVRVGRHRIRAAPDPVPGGIPPLRRI